MFLLALVLALASAAAASPALLPHRARGGVAWQQQRAALDKLAATSPFHAGDAPVPQYFSQRLDHSGHTEATFQQKFYVNATYFNASAPLAFIEIGGEGPCTSYPTGFIASLAQQHGALLVSLEHRFYGESVPDHDFSTNNLRYLTVNQALDDVKTFMDAFAFNGTSKFKWFVFGGSYSGALSAWFHVKYPGAAAGSLASSGVVNAIESFVEFDEQIAISAGPACADQLRAITAAFESEFRNGAAADMKALFNAPLLLDDDFFYMIADSGAMAVQYGNKASLCAALPPPNSDTATLTHAFANFTVSFWGASFASDCFYDTNCIANDPSKWQPTSRAWRWQKCSELAYFQVAPPVGSIRSQRVNMRYCLQQCEAMFGIPNMQPATNEINRQFGGATPVESNTFYSNGSDDPWQRAAVAKTLSASQPELTAVCDGCGHCGDLEPYAHSAAVTKQRAAFAEYLTEWLAA